MFLRVVLLSLVAAGAQAFSLHWRGLPARKFALAPQALPNRAAVPNSNFAPPQTLAIWDEHSQTRYNPNFTPKRDKTIAWDGQDGMCLEATGGKNGDAIRINRCTGGPTQVWNVLSQGDVDVEKDHIQLQLDGTNKCIAVDDRKGQLNGAPAELQECDNIVTESWVFNESLKVKEPSRSRYNVSTPFAGFAILGLAFMSFSTWLWRKRQLRSVGMQQRSAFQSPLKESISLRELVPAALMVRPLTDQPARRQESAEAFQTGDQVFLKERYEFAGTGKCVEAGAAGVIVYIDHVGNAMVQFDGHDSSRSIVKHLLGTLLEKKSIKQVVAERRALEQAARVAEDQAAERAALEQDCRDCGGTGKTMMAGLQVPEWLGGGNCTSCSGTGQQAFVHQGATPATSSASAAVADPSGSSGVSDISGVSDEQRSLYRRVYKDAMSGETGPKLLGEGAHGEVWKIDLSDGSGTFALKLTDIGNGRGIAIAKGETRALGACQDLYAKAEELTIRSETKDFVTDWKRAASTLVRYFYFDEDNASSPPYHYVVMEYVEGVPLDKFEGTLTEAQKISVMIQIAEVISLMSSFELGFDRSWVHRDIWPANVMIKINEDDTVDVKIIDLGLIANSKNRIEKGFDRCPWAPPEQRSSHRDFESCIVGLELYDAKEKELRSACAFDMYSLGILMIQICCGMDNHLPVTAPEEADENMKRCVKDFFSTELGRLVSPLTGSDPCDRPRPHAVLSDLHTLSDYVHCSARTRQFIESSRIPKTRTVRLRTGKK